MKQKYKRFIRTLQADQSRLANAVGMLVERIHKLENKAEDLSWRIDEATPRLPAVDEPALRDVLRRKA